MNYRWGASGVVRSDGQPLSGWTGFVDTLLRGIAQVMLQNNSYSGLLLLLGLWLNSSLFAAAALLGTLVSTTCALWLGAERTQIRDGLHGYNGTLVAIALVYFLQPTALTWAVVVLACALASVVTLACQTLLQPWRLPALTAPFVLVTLLLVLAIARLGHLHATHQLPTAALPVAATVEGVVVAATLWQGLLNGVAQVFLQENPVSGALFLLALLVSSRRAALAAAGGALLGLMLAWLLGGAESAMRAGAYGFNSALVVLALEGWLSVRHKTAWLILAGLVAALVFAALSTALAALGVPALTLPFVLVVWLFLLAARQLPGQEG